MPREKRGYHQVVLCKNKSVNHVGIHRLVAIAFLTKDSERTQVNHIDGNKSNNKLSNLEWVTPKENTAHAFNIGVRNYKKHAELMKKIHAKPVIQFDVSGNLIQKFDSAADASRETGMRPDTIHLQCKFNRMPTKTNFYFRYANQSEKGDDHHRIG